MSYRIRSDEGFDEGIRRALGERVDEALRLTEEAEEAPEEAVHEIRKRLKEIRGALRLVRLHLPEAVFDRENVDHRDTGRLLAEAREAQVAPETLERLVAETPELSGDEEALEHASERLEEDRGELHRKAMEPGGAVEEARERLLVARERVPTLPLSGLDAPVLARGVWKVYKRGFRRRQDAYEEGKAPVFHEWRKRVKYLWYHLQLLTCAWPEMMKPWARQQHELSDHLGLGNDVADLERLLADQPRVIPAEPIRRAVLDAAARVRIQSWEEARSLGSRLYAEDPGALECRVARYLGGR
jgi:CHAD domain-containing protein